MSMTMMEIEKALNQLRLSGMHATLETRVLEAQAADLSFLETFSAILQDELDRRQSRQIELRYKQSGLDERTSWPSSTGASIPRSPSAPVSNSTH